MTSQEQSLNYQSLAKDYTNLSPELKTRFLQEMYWKRKMGFGDIAKLTNTYSNRVLRDARKLGIRIRTRKEAQKLALETGRSKHPTEGRPRPEEVKDKVSKGLSKRWQKLSDEEKEKHREISKKNWEQKSDIEKQNMRHKAAKKIREASISGSKMERFLLEVLIEAGYQDVSCHKEHLLKNERMHIDLFCPSLGLAIEVDGPSHFRDLWNNRASFHRKQQADHEKNGMLLSQGLIVVRVQQKNDISRYFKDKVKGELLEIIEKIKKEKPDRANRLIYIGDE